MTAFVLARVSRFFFRQRARFRQDANTPFAGAEAGDTEPESTFPKSFGAPFLLRHPSVHGNLVKKRVAGGNLTSWLVNTGWTGDAYVTGRRIPISVPRGSLNAALSDWLLVAEYRRDPFFGFKVPVAAQPVDIRLLDPLPTSRYPNSNAAAARKLMDLSNTNLTQFDALVDAGVGQAAPFGRAYA